MPNKDKFTKRNPNKIGKRKFMIEQIYIEESEEEMDTYSDQTEEDKNG